MRVIIDRFEGDFAVVELQNKQFCNMPKQLVPSEAREGDVIDITVDDAETQKRKDEIKKIMGALWKE